MGADYETMEEEDRRLVQHMGGVNKETQADSSPPSGTWFHLISLGPLMLVRHL